MEDWAIRGVMFLVDDLFTVSDFPHKELFDSVNYVWEVLPKLAGYLKKQKSSIRGTVHHGAFLKNEEQIFIDEGTIVEPGAFIEGPCWIGKGCEVRHGAYIRGNVITGHHCVIGHTSEVKNSILLNNAKASHFAYVGDSILGNNVNLGAGTKLANLRFDRQEILIRTGGQIIPTGLTKLGAIFGDGSQTGCNAVTNPGTIFLKNAFCFPCENVGGVKK